MPASFHENGLFVKLSDIMHRFNFKKNFIKIDTVVPVIIEFTGLNDHQIFTLISHERLAMEKLMSK